MLGEKVWSEIMAGKMKENKLIIEIDCQASRIFEFTLNPSNTPLWISGLVHEEADGFPARIGTTYENLDKSGKWTTYELVQFEANVAFEMKEKGGPYHVRYTFDPVSDKKTRLTYFEWVENGELKEPFSFAILEKLKGIVERQRGVKKNG